ncbi:hypothetical protein KY290_025069 [Solanum tuberosum]|uniref:Uncharacterized protein n=1 Tax=Solanum tuberosum TaxID=4113 RepID=A0ABQ7USG3_SOLTU|nr:hypothetical protein KY290_025069 [Solanum tuberosum]
MTSAESEEHEKLLTQMQWHMSCKCFSSCKAFTKKMWIIDSGATEHMSCNKEFFLNLIPLPRIVSGPSMKSPMLLGESQNGLYIL